MILEVDVRAAGVLQGLARGSTKTAFVIVNTLNSTIKGAQAAQRTNVRSRLTLRKPDFVLRQAAVIKAAAGGSGFASVKQGRFEARLAIGQKDRLLLSMLELGGTRPAFGGGRRVAVPLTGSPARPTFSQSVVPALRVKALRLVKIRAGNIVRTKKGRSRRERRTVDFHAHVTATGKIQIKGRLRTFVLEGTARAPQGGIYQRVGPGRDDIRLIYPFVARPALKSILHWMRTAKESVHQFPAELRRNVVKELRRGLRQFA